MTKEFKLPELGENIISADVLNVLVKPGDHIEKDQTVIEIETDKATIEVPSTVEGVIKEVFIKPGDKINVGAVLITVESAPSKEDKSIATTPAPPAEVPIVPPIPVPSKDSAKIQSREAAPSASNSELPIVEFKLPELGENIESADVLNVLVKIGDMITKDQGVLEIETDKATIEVPSTVEGKVVGINIKPGKKQK